MFFQVFATVEQQVKTSIQSPDESDEEPWDDIGVYPDEEYRRQIYIPDLYEPVRPFK